MNNQRITGDRPREPAVIRTAPVVFGGTLRRDREAARFAILRRDLEKMLVGLAARIEETHSHIACNALHREIQFPDLGRNRQLSLNSDITAAAAEVGIHQEPAVLDFE